MLRTLFLFGAAGLFAQDSIVLKTSTLFDGKGKTVHNTIIVVEGGKIARVGGAPPPGAVTYDLTGLHGFARLDRHALSYRESFRQ